MNPRLNLVVALGSLEGERQWRDGCLGGSQVWYEPNAASDTVVFEAREAAAVIQYPAALRHYRCTALRARYAEKINL